MLESLLMVAALGVEPRHEHAERADRRAKVECAPAPKKRPRPPVARKPVEEPEPSDDRFDGIDHDPNGLNDNKD